MPNINRMLQCVLIFTFSVMAQSGDASVETWEIDNISSVAGYSTTVLGNPVVVEDDGKAVEFDGVDDGLIVNANPVAGAQAFTVEVIFKPYASASPDNIEQRFVHMQESDDRRLLIELRLTGDGHWFLDTFIKDGASSRTLYAENFPHPAGEWAHAALVYDNGMMRHYVNGAEEMSGQVLYAPMQSGQTSIGVRLNQRSWYKGAIRLLRVTHHVLSPEEFMTELSHVQQNEVNRQTYRLIRNYPNPFNTSTVIHYNVSEQCAIQVSVFDIAGREVDTLVDGIQPAGEYRMKWDASLFNSGSYQCRIREGEHAQTIQMLHIK
ncbi:T9SS type A sorting domain-containing protein [bacterium]|nr:T9SS type A sorting domain-containing protein [bacterium]